MPSDDLIRAFMSDTKNDLHEIKGDVKHLMRFRWMVMGGAATASFFFAILFEIAKAMAGGK